MPEVAVVEIVAVAVARTAAGSSMSPHRKQQKAVGFVAIAEMRPVVAVECCRYCCCLSRMETTRTMMSDFDLTLLVPSILRMMIRMGLRKKLEKWFYKKMN
jgi:hypothetical protein